jgi:hypothetical protein
MIKLHKGYLQRQVKPFFFSAQVDSLNIIYEYIICKLVICLSSLFVTIEISLPRFVS